LEEEQPDSNCNHPTSQNPDIFCQRFSKFYRVKPICGALKNHKFDFKQQRVRIKTFNPKTDQELFKLLPYDIEDVAGAGFVKTSKMTAACYSCLVTVDWSSSEARITPSPWALHAWRNSQLENCCHLKYHLKDKENRLKTFPRHCFYLEKCSAFELSEAGFYCMSRNVGGYLWVRCHQKHCSAHGYYLRPNNKYNAFKRVLTKDFFDSVPSKIHNKEKKLEVPGSGQNDGHTPLQRETPIVDHFIQNPACQYIINYLESKENRLKTFPPEWEVRNNLDVIVDEVAAAGYIYYPESTDSKKTSKAGNRTMQQLLKLHAISRLCTLSPFTICPSPDCHQVIDWSIICQKYDLKRRGIMTIPEIRHCT
jgi:hypothetical protein